MSNSFKRFGSVRPANTDEVELFGIPADRMGFGEVYVCNTIGSTATFRLAVVATDIAAVLATGDFIVYDESLPGNSSKIFTFHMEALNSFRVRSGTVDSISFLAMGQETDV